MSVRKRKWRAADGTPREAWVIDVTHRHPDGRVERVRETSPASSRRDAEAHERLIVSALLDGAYRKEVSAPKAVPTVDAFAKDFIEKYAEVNNKPSEVTCKKSVIEQHIKPKLGAMRLDEVGPRQVEEFKAYLAKGRSPKTVNTYLGVLGKMLGIAMEWGHIEAVPRLRKLKVGQQPFDFLTFDEAERLMASVEPEWAAMVLTALKTGLRHGELLALRRQDVDLVAGRLVVRRSVWRGIIGTPKNGKSREVPLSDEARSMLRRHRHMKGEVLFCRPDGSMLTAEQCRGPLERACKKAGLRLIGWHTLRHTFASHLVMRGAPIKAVQELLGHSSITMTMRYAHLAPEVTRDAVQLLDAPAPKAAPSRHMEGT